MGKRLRFTVISCLGALFGIRLPFTSTHLSVSHRNGNACSRKEGYNLSEPEVTEAIKLLDKNGDKLIQFNEFVEWWQDKVSNQSFKFMHELLTLAFKITTSWSCKAKVWYVYTCFFVNLFLQLTPRCR